MAESKSEREWMARIIDPAAFRDWNSLFDYCIDQGDEPIKAERCADQFYAGPRQVAYEKADRIIAGRRALEASEAAR